MNKKPKVAIFLNHPQCSVQSVHGIIRALYTKYDIDCVDKNDLKDRVLKKYDLLAFPGGVGDSDTWDEIIAPAKDCILNQISKGKRYLGICMGAYWAGKYYFNLIDSEQIQYITRTNAEVKRSFSTTVQINWLGKEEMMYFYDGCSLTSDQPHDIIAKYKNGDSAAIIQNNIGLIGPHPESDIYWFDKPYMKPHWHKYRHHKLLLNFVNKLF